MPQLRDSGTRSLHATEPVPSAEMDGFCRIFGVETEYGVAVTGAERPVDAGQVAMTMFQPIVSRSRSTNTYLANGSRLYLDVGSHPEYATAEARDPREALAQDLAGEHVMRNLALKAQRKLRESYGAHATIHVFKNNVDSAGHAFGCHENYLVRRFVPLETIEHQLLPFLITRQLYTGAGRMTPDGFQITQRADFLDEAVSSATTRSRPMVNTRDEPHAELTLESGESVSALGLQRRYYAAVKAFIETHVDALASSLPATTIDTIMGEWSRVLDALECGAYDALADRVDWAAKKRLFDALKRRRPDVTFAQLEQLELDYHDIANGRLYGSLTSRNQLRELLTADDVEYAVHNPPADTRAALRGQFVRAALAAGAQFSADWTHLTVTAPERREAVLLDPFESEPTEEFTHLMSALQ